ncbi:NAD-dependent epimerase/dehydratase family protein [Sphingomonas sp. ID1715]|uniref:NAD-dependent epimerase/dehydratase family protein n=1 Tax=Sphingomonas sp. ID1715 TaxID=1656898 RepID=UPI0014877422|nr:NAD-dependent epimerase/dehydratase family protein [Sphingomonas sp. ID1715]NNM77792.1 NAD-dependent epimerase/dehydratase family protein [Sphingomonas sp. ID1715]
MPDEIEQHNEEKGSQRPLVLVTGASGFIGSAVVRKLGKTYTVVGLDRAGPPDPPAPAVAVDFDLGSDEDVDKALADVRARFGSRIASVIHLAAYYDVSGKPNPLYQKITVEGTRRLIDALQDFEVEQFVYASTMLVHRPTERPDQRINEDSPIDPLWAYPESKAETEALLASRHGKIPVVFLRIAGVYDDMGHSAFLAEQISRIYEHRTTAHFYPGMLCAAQSSIHLDDLTDAVERLVDRRKRLPPVLPLLVGEPDALGYAETQDIIGRTLHGEDWTTLRIPKPLAAAGVWLQNEALEDKPFIKPWMVEQSDAHYILDIHRAHDLLGWQPKHSLRETLPRIVEALKADPTSWYKTNKLNPALVAWYGHTPAHRLDDGTSRGGDEASAAHHEHDMGGHGSGHDDHMAMMERDEARTRWAHFANMGLGLWLASSPLVFGVADPSSVAHRVVAVTVERGLPPIEWRSLALAWSDVVTGLLIVLFGALSLSKRTAWFGQWAACFAGLWLLFAPLIFWAPTATVYSNDMLVGALVIAFSVLVPMMPGMSMAGMMDPKVIPPGWTYCPSTAAQRLPIVIMGVVGLLISRHLTAYQFGHIDNVWEPFFAGSAADPRNGTAEIITSSVSKAWPIPDAGLGAVSYMIEILMAVMGTRDRWRTMPWMVTFFGILVIPLGVISIYFIIIQPIVIGTWSTPALIAGLAMLLMIPFALDEVIAMGQFLYWSWCRGKPLIRTFFKGDAVDRGEEYAADALTASSTAWSEAKRGVTLPWTLAASIAIGAFLMLTRLVFGTEGAMADSDHLMGALTITVAIITTAEVARALRFVNMAFGAWLVMAPFLLDGAGTVAAAAGIVLGVALIALSFPRGRRSEEHYAGWDRFVL